MHAFAKHGIDHLSPSSVNLWMSHPAGWVARYCLRIKDEGNAAMWRGTAVEVGKARLLRGGSIEEAKADALQTFELNAGGDLADDVEAERRLIGPMLDVIAKAIPILNLGSLNATQLRVEHWFEDLPIPVIGYIDFAFDPLDLDLKSTKACPSKPRGDNARQIALYMAARQKRGMLLYVTDKRFAPYELSKEDAESALSDLEVSARSLYWFLGRVDDGKDAMRCLPWNTDDFRSNPKTKVALADILSAG